MTIPSSMAWKTNLETIPWRLLSTQYDPLYTLFESFTLFHFYNIRAKTSGQKNDPLGQWDINNQYKLSCRGEERADKGSLLYAAPLVHTEETKTVVLTGENGPLTHISPPSVSLSSDWTILSNSMSWWATSSTPQVIITLRLSSEEVCEREWRAVRVRLYTTLMWVCRGVIEVE